LDQSLGIDFQDRIMNALVITTLSVSAVSSTTGMILFRYGGCGNTMNRRVFWWCMLLFFMFVRRSILVALFLVINSPN
jgi:hypothetical protein